MDTRTGEIYELPAGKQAPAGHIPLTPLEATYLKGRAAKTRLAALKQYRQNLIKAAKRKAGRRLEPDEMGEICQRWR